MRDGRFEMGLDIEDLQGFLLIQTGNLPTPPLPLTWTLAKIPPAKT